MPWRRENRFTSVLLAAVLLLCVIGVWGIVAVTKHGGSTSTPLVYFVGGFVLLSLKIVLGMLQAEFAYRRLLTDSSRTRHDLKGELHAVSLTVQEAAATATAAANEVVKQTNGNLERAVQVAAEEVRVAEREQFVTISDIQAIVDRSCAKTAELAADAAVRKYVEAMRQQQQGGA